MVCQNAFQNWHVTKNPPIFSNHFLEKVIEGTGKQEFLLIAHMLGKISPNTFIKKTVC